MAGEEELFEMFEDLEAQAEALQHLERAAEVADRTRAEYGAVTLDSRLMASLGQPVEVDVRAVGRLGGQVERVGPGWFQLGSGSGTWWVRTPAVTSVRGASSRAVPEVAWSPLHKLGLASALRRLADEGEHVVLQLVDGTRHEGRVARVGADFVELDAGRDTEARGRGQGAAGSVLVSVEQLASVRAEA